jgi:hypothetical protein
MRFVVAPALLLASVTAPIQAQLAPVGVPRGTLRIDLQGQYQSAASSYLDGTKQDLLGDFSSPALGADRFDAVRSADSLIAVVVGNAGNGINLGRVHAQGIWTSENAIIGVSLGVTSKLTLFADFPIIRSRVQAKVVVDSATGLAGINPAHPGLGTSDGQAAANQFFQQFSDALTTLQQRIGNGSYSGQQLALAQAIAARGTQMRDALARLTSDPNQASPFLPTDTSAAGRAITAAVVGLQDTLANQLGVAGFTNPPVLATAALTTSDYQSFISNPNGPVAGFPLGETLINRLGDMDVGASYTLIDRWDRGGSEHPGGLRLALTSLLRLPTGLRDDPNDFLDTGTGNGRYEVGLSGTLDLGRGRWGARLTGGYLLRLPTNRVRRVAPPSEPIAFLDRLTNVRINAGDVASLGAQPFFRLTGGLAIRLSADYWRQGADQVSYLGVLDSIPGVSASVLAQDSQRSALALGAGLSYVGRTAECEAGGHCGLPIEADWGWSTVATATGGRVAKTRQTQVEIRWYFRLWQ